MNRGPGGNTIIGIIIVIVVAAMLVAGVTIYKHENRKKSVPSATSQSAPAQTGTEASTTVPVSTTAEIKIPELNIKITAPSSLSDLTYTTSSYSAAGESSPVADFTTTSLVKLEPACSKGTAALGRLIKTSGQYPSDTTLASGKLVKQFSSFYISYNSPQASCAINNSSAQSLLDSQRKDFQTALSSVQSL